jgi:hypothetical protein
MYFKGKLASVEGEFTQRMHATALHGDEVAFDQKVREYKAIEAEFIARASEDEADILATKRRIMWWVLASAIDSLQPPEVCREIWNEINRIGFADMDHRHTMSNIYARCCQCTGEFNTGIGVLDPLIKELEQWLPQAPITPEERIYWEKKLEIHKEVVAELEADIAEPPDSSPSSPSR